MKQPYVLRIFRRAADRLNNIVSAKKIAKAEGRRDSSTRPSSVIRRCEAFLKALIRGREPSYFCTHFRVGSSNVLTLLQGNYTFKKAHSIMMTPFIKRNIGMAGEQAFMKRKPRILKIHPFVVSKTNPWVCATPDFLILQDGQQQHVEIKTFLDEHDAAQFVSKVPHRILIQVWLGMELLGLAKGSIFVYVLDEVSRRVTLFGKVFLVRAASFFSREVYTLSAFHYARFLRDYFDQHKLFPSEAYMSSVALRLAGRFREEDYRKAEAGDEPVSRYNNGRKVELTCQFYETTVENAVTQPKEMTGFDAMFKGHIFRNPRPLTRTVVLDGEIRREILNSCLSHLTQEVRNKFEELLKQAQDPDLSKAVRAKKVSVKVSRIKEHLAEDPLQVALNRVTQLERQLAQAKEKAARAEEEKAKMAIELERAAKAKKHADKSKRRKRDKARSAGTSSRQQEAQTSKNSMAQTATRASRTND
jgi:hypothetical protein